MTTQFTIQQINNQFKNKLKKVYSNAEIQQLRFMVYEKLLGLTKINAITNTDKPVSVEKFSELNLVADRLANNEPIQYILGETEFYNLIFKVSPAVLIPRPETEELVHWILSSCKTPGLKILDVGTGSGCIAVSLAKNIENAEVYALDISSSALEIAQQNAKSNNVELNFIECSILNVEYYNLPAKLDILVSNPPYVKENEKVLMKPNVLDNEPDIALFVSNERPLIFYEKIAHHGTKLLKKNGLLFFEINEALGNEVKLMLENFNYSGIEIRKDFDGKNRMIKATL